MAEDWPICLDTKMGYFYRVWISAEYADEGYISRFKYFRI